jgi:tetratricopeptide (TPR) repeat protein
MRSIVLVMLLAATAPSSDIAPSLAHGRALHDAGDYDGAIAVYEAVLAKDPKNRQAAYERVFSTWTKKDLPGARNLGEKILKSDPDPLPEVYSMLGSICDDSGDQGAALAVFRRGIARYPRYSPLRFNLAVMLAGQGKVDDAAAGLREALALEPNHPGSWLQLGFVERKRGEPGYALVAFARFLSLEPQSRRSAMPARALGELLMAGVTHGEPKDGKEQINITLPMTGGKPSTGNQQAAMLALAGAARYLEKWENKTDDEFFVEGMQSALAILSEAQPKDRGQRFWAGCAFEYFEAARTAGHAPAMAYDIRRSLGDEEIDRWIAAHSKEVDDYRAWSRAWKTTSCSASMK